MDLIKDLTFEKVSVKILMISSIVLSQTNFVLQSEPIHFKIFDATKIHPGLGSLSLAMKNKSPTFDSISSLFDSDCRCKTRSNCISPRFSFFQTHNKIAQLSSAENVGASNCGDFC